MANIILGNVKGAKGDRGDKGDKGAIFRFCGDWESGRKYCNNSEFIDIVKVGIWKNNRRGENLYTCVTDECIGKYPDEDSVDWKVMLEGGLDGANGRIYFYEGVWESNKNYQGSADLGGESNPTTVSVVSVSKTLVDEESGFEYASECLYACFISHKAEENITIDSKMKLGNLDAYLPYWFLLNQNIQGKSMRFRSGYTAQESYYNTDIVYDVVTYNGSSYIPTKRKVTGVLPTNSEYWQLICARGAQGESGNTSKDSVFYGGNAFSFANGAHGHEIYGGSAFERFTEFDRVIDGGKA